MKMTLTSKLISKDEECAHVSAQISRDFKDKELIQLHFIAMLRAMRDSYEHEFYVAMTEFINEEMDDMEGDDD